MRPVSAKDSFEPLPPGEGVIGAEPEPTRHPHPNPSCPPAAHRIIADVPKNVPKRKNLSMGEGM